MLSRVAKPTTSLLKSQFGHPTGWLGRLVGWVMAKKNLPINRVVVDFLAPRSDERILEIGFGPGVALSLLAPEIKDGMLAGIDLSAEMVRQARRRNHRWINSGCMELHRGSAEDLPWGDGTFDTVFAVNVFHHWNDEGRSALQQIQRVLMKGGRLVLAIRTISHKRGRMQAPGVDRKELFEIRERLEMMGFQPVEISIRPAGDREIAILSTRLS